MKKAEREKQKAEEFIAKAIQDLLESRGVDASGGHSDPDKIMKQSSIL